MRISKPVLGWAKMALFVGVIVLAAYKLAFVRELLFCGSVFFAIHIPVFIVQKLGERIEWVGRYSAGIQFVVYILSWVAAVIWLLPTLGLQYNDQYWGR